MNHVSVRCTLEKEYFEHVLHLCTLDMSLRWQMLHLFIIPILNLLCGGKYRFQTFAYVNSPICSYVIANLVQELEWRRHQLIDLDLEKPSSDISNCNWTCYQLIRNRFYCILLACYSFHSTVMTTSVMPQMYLAFLLPKVAFSSQSSLWWHRNFHISSRTKLNSCFK